MLSEEKNERLTRVGPNTPGGQLLRRYWQALWPACDFTAEHPKKRLKVLDEDLVVYRGDDGTFGCVAERCTHRGCSLYYGFIEDGAIRCPYHGWKFDPDGRCVEQPFEPAEQYLQRSRAPARLPGAGAGRPAVRVHGAAAGAAVAALGYARAQGRHASSLRSGPRLRATGCKRKRTPPTPPTPTTCTATRWRTKGITWESARYYLSPDRVVRFLAVRVGHHQDAGLRRRPSGRRSPPAADLPEHLAHPGRP